MSIAFITMGFWQNVDDELQYLGKTRKELAAEADFDASYIPKGIARDGVPLADLALRIAHALGVSLEYLLDLPDPLREHFTEKSSRIQHKKSYVQKKSADEIFTAMRLYRKYAKYIDMMENFSAKKLEAVEKILELLEE